MTTIPETEIYFLGIPSYQEIWEAVSTQHIFLIFFLSSFCFCARTIMEPPYLSGLS